MKSYKQIARMIQAEREYLNTLNKNWLSGEERKALNKIMGGRLTNEDRARLELYEFKKYKPSKYIGYLNVEGGRYSVTNWTGEPLTSSVARYAGSFRETRGAMGESRIYFRAEGVNGVSYRVLAFENGMYCYMYKLN